MKLEIARPEAEQQAVPNVEFQLSDIWEALLPALFDVVYAGSSSHT